MARYYLFIPDHNELIFHSLIHVTELNPIRRPCPVRYDDLIDAAGKITERFTVAVRADLRVDTDAVIMNRRNDRRLATEFSIDEKPVFRCCGVIDIR